jgi:hypothetical protein
VARGKGRDEREIIERKYTLKGKEGKGDRGMEKERKEDVKKIWKN